MRDRLLRAGSCRPARRVAARCGRRRRRGGSADLACGGIPCGGARTRARDGDGRACNRAAPVRGSLTRRAGAAREPDGLAEAVQQHADANDARTPEHALEPAQPAVPIAALATICGRCAERHLAASAGDRAEARGRCRRHALDCAAATALRLRANAGTRHAMARGAAAAASPRPRSRPLATCVSRSSLRPRC